MSSARTCRAIAAAGLLALVAACSGLGRRAAKPPVLDPVLVQRGGHLFLSPSLSGHGERSCASCHPGGGSNGFVYLEGRSVPVGTPGARKVPRLFGLWETAPYLWDGSAPDLEAALDRMLRVDMRGGTLEASDRRALLAYLSSLRRYDRGRITDDGAPAEPNTLRQRRGFELFHRRGCDRCHTPPSFASPRAADIGTGPWNPPTLRGLLSPGAAPFGHDGRWPTLEEAVRAHGRRADRPLDDRELEALMEYLKLL
ncbi:MAG: cytochrome c peroxidase [Myxococcota bacterium]